MYNIKLDVANQTAYITMSGFWTIETVTSYYQEKNTAIDAIIRAGNSLEDVKILFDISTWETQSREVSEKIEAMDDRNIKAAVIVQSAMLPRKQSQRLAGDRYQFFNNKEEAIAWLHQSHS